MSERWRETYDQWKLSPPPEYEGSDEEDDNWDDGEDSDEWVHDCGDPECCMNFQPHFRSECHTPEMIEAMENEHHG